MSITTDMKLLKFFTILFGLITSICGQCRVDLPADPLLRPKIWQVIGLHKIPLPIAENTKYLHIFHNQKIELYCDTAFESSNWRVNEDKAIVECSSGNSFYYECSPLKWKLFESVPNFHWCGNNMTSYILARPTKNSDQSGYEYLAGICYDIDANSFKTLYYRMTPKHINNFHPEVLSQFYTPVYEIKHYREIFHKRGVSEQDYDNDVFRDWMKYSQYNLSSILQNPRINKQFYAGSILDFNWWPSLRLGNWKRYEMALEKYIENANHSFDILSGVSDVVKAPIIESCSTNFSLVDFTDNVNHKIPFYVWNYLQATDKSSEIVIIGVNSPFYEFYAEKDVIFCLDKCQEIPWLKAKSSTFRYSAMGIIFCCSVDDVRQSKRLDGFLEINMEPPPHVSPADEYILSTTIESEYQDNDDDNANNYD